VIPKVTFIARILVGLILFVFGLNGFCHFIPFPPMSGPPADFAAAMTAAGYFFPFVHGTEVAAGALLLSGRFVPLALTVIAPVVLNILMFHAFLAPSGLGPPVAITALGALIAWGYRSTFRVLLRADARPDSVSDGPGLRGTPTTRASE
jgi:uncharacterized membrane protein YphA (DoxX/SURF4 family)